MDSLNPLICLVLVRAIACPSTGRKSHPVHPELVLGTFRYKDCGTVIRDVEQQFKYIEVTNFRTHYALFIAIFSHRYVLIPHVVIGKDLNY